MLTVSLQFDYCREALVLPSGRFLAADDVSSPASPYRILGSVFRFGKALARLQLDNTEAALFGSLLVLHPGKKFWTKVNLKSGRVRSSPCGTLMGPAELCCLSVRVIYRYP